MNPKERAIDEYTLAAFLAGTLPDEERREVIAHLSHDAEAREMLRLTVQALEASSAKARSLAEDEHPRATDRKPRQHAVIKPMLGIRRLFQYGAAAVAVFAVGLSLRLTLGPSADQYRGPENQDALVIEMLSSRGDLNFQWARVDGAYTYRVVIWDPAEASVVSETTLQTNRLDTGNREMSEIKSRLRPGRTYQLRVDAVDADNRLVRSSSPLDFKLDP